MKESLLLKTYVVYCDRLLKLTDWFVDRRICGRSLVTYVPSIFRDDKKGLGGTGSSSTHYGLLKRIFSHVELTPGDILLDVGCGKGRVLAFLLREKCPCRLYGVEHNPEVGRIAAEWTRSYPQVSVFIGDAFALDYAPYTVLTLARSFLPVTFLAFIERLEQTLTHSIRLVSWYAQRNSRLLKDRPGWTLEYTEKVLRIHGVRTFLYPQTFTVWTYDPAKRTEPSA